MASQLSWASPTLSSGAVAELLLQRGMGALERLLEARDFARDVGRNVWDFALEMETLNHCGLTHSDLRWLVCKGYLEHLSEIYPGSGHERAFRPSGALTFTATSCFVITESGAELLMSNASASESAGENSRWTDERSDDVERWDRPLVASPSVEPLGALQPRWDRDRQELWIDQRIVKQFKVPAPNQQVVLAVFDEEGWPVRIDDPLPPRPQLDPKRRLHDTINSLNRNQKTPLIRFQGDGSGRGIRWEVSGAALSS